MSNFDMLYKKEPALAVFILFALLREKWHLVLILESQIRCVRGCALIDLVPHLRPICVPGFE